MLIKAKTLRGYTLESVNGEIGSVKEFYFDDCHWTIRYLVADTGNWLTGKQVLISPYALLSENKKTNRIVVNLTKEQIENSPSLNSDMPVSRQFEEVYNGYYEWPTYWGGPYMWGSCPYLDVRDRENRCESTLGKKVWDSHLRSTHEVSGYHVNAVDGEIGHIEDFIIDDETWAIRYLVIDTRNWFPGKNVLVSPQWIERISWNESNVFFKIPMHTIRQSPEYTDETLLNRDYEISLHKHYSRQGYWVDGNHPAN
ncbi:MAG: PRC-barrel domain-containing protein [Desulfuromonadales bacterium]|nr:PRC-barrel domain-containing protein [Desulfuromonadales bacterium]